MIDNPDSRPTYVPTGTIETWLARQELARQLDWSRLPRPLNVSIAWEPDDRGHYGLAVIAHGDSIMSILDQPGGDGECWLVLDGEGALRACWRIGSENGEAGYGPRLA